MDIFNEMDRIIETFGKAADKFKKCKGKNCEAIGGVGHSMECEKEHDDTVNHAKPPSCFDRAEHGGRLFDNCRFFQVCKDVQPICCNYPIGE